MAGTKTNDIAHINTQIPGQAAFMVEVCKMFNNAGKAKHDQAKKGEMLGAIVYHYSYAWLKANDYLDAAVRAYETQTHKVFDHELYTGFRLTIEPEEVDEEEPKKEFVSDGDMQDILSNIDATKA